jgi:DNA polymerase
VGQAGRLLDSMLAAIAMKRGENVYIANIVKCRPPGNRTPEPGEAAQCEPYLQRQIALIQPRLIVALGKTAAVNLLRREATIASLRGRVHDWRGIPLIVTYHPAYLLRNLPDKAKAWEDLCFAVATMRGLLADESAPA